MTCNVLLLIYPQTFEPRYMERIGSSSLTLIAFERLWNHLSKDDQCRFLAAHKPPRNKVWKMNFQEVHGRMCEDGSGDEGLLIYAEDEMEAILKIYQALQRDAKIASYLPFYFFAPGVDQGQNEWEALAYDDFPRLLTHALTDQGWFLKPFPQRQIL